MTVALLLALAGCVGQAIVLLDPWVEEQNSPRAKRQLHRMAGGGPHPIRPRTRRGRKIAAGLWLAVALALAVGAAWSLL